MCIEATESPEWTRDALAGGITPDELATYSQLQARIYTAIDLVRSRPDYTMGAQGSVNELRTWDEGRALPGVYAIRHLPTGREYIGKSRDMRSRLMDHFNAMTNGDADRLSPPLLEDYLRDGIYAFEWCVLEWFPLGTGGRLLLDAEARWIRHRKPHYNRLHAHKWR